LQEEALGSLRGIKVASLNPSISHLLFANDLMIYTQANVQEATSVLRCLSTYSKWLGQCINLSKSTVFFSKNYSVISISMINGILNTPLIPAMAKYLSIPLFMSNNKIYIDAFIDIKDQICSKISGWKAKLLFQAAHATMLKLVVNAIPTYLMSHFFVTQVSL
jgi:hypothetical protein